MDDAPDPIEQAIGDPAVAFGPGERADLVWFAAGEVMQAGPRRDRVGARAIIVPARVVDRPPQPWRIEPLIAQPLGHARAVERRRPHTERHRDGELPGRPRSVNVLLEA